MDLKKRKIQFIQEFFQLESEDVISKFEMMLKEEKEKHPRNFAPMNVDALNGRILASLEDSDKGRVTQINELLAQIEKWN